MAIAIPYNSDNITNQFRIELTTVSESKYFELYFHAVVTIGLTVVLDGLKTS